MHQALFISLIVTLLVALAATVAGLLVQWGIIISPLVEKGEELPLLGGLVTGVIISSVGLVLEMSRRAFLSRPDATQRTYLELLGIAVVEGSDTRTAAEATHTAIADYFTSYAEEFDSETKSGILSQMSIAVGKAVQTKYGGSDVTSPVSEVLVSEPGGY